MGRECEKGEIGGLVGTTRVGEGGEVGGRGGESSSTSIGTTR